MNSITLEDSKAAKLMKRIDVKYILSYEQFCDLINIIKDDFMVVREHDNILFRYHTIYFDTNSLDILKDHQNKKLHRQKIRIREYSSGEKFIEIKDKNNHVTNKIRVPVESYELDGETQWISKNLIYDTKNLKKTLDVNFYRLTLVSNDKNIRVTIDFQLEVYNYESKYSWSFKEIILEIKKPDELITSIENTLNDFGLKPQGFSKYNVGMVLTA